jgi:3-hydroxyacyl-CoA dehydrogenase
MFKTTDLVGLDTMGHVAKNTYELVDDEPATVSKCRISSTAMIEKKLLGKKTKAGFYKTDLTPEWKKIRKVIDPKTLEYKDLRQARLSLPGSRRQGRHARRKGSGHGLRRRQGIALCLALVAENLIYSAEPHSGDFRHNRGDRQCHALGLRFGTRTLRRLGPHGGCAHGRAHGKRWIEGAAKIKKMLAAGQHHFYKIENGPALFYDFASEGYKPIQTRAHHDLPGHAQGRQQGGSGQ